MAFYTIDIETLGVPEQLGFNLVMPNYAVVQIPERLTAQLNWLYVRMPIEEQKQQGLKYDPQQTFWNDCKTSFPDAQREMAKSYDIEHDEVLVNGKEILYPNVPEELRKFIHGTTHEIDVDTKMFGNGCNFDCSITTANHLIRYDDADLWHYASPQNLRTLRLMLSQTELNNMTRDIQPHLDLFCANVNNLGIMERLELHNPLFDAAKEALYATWCINLLKSS